MDAFLPINSNRTTQRPHPDQSSCVCLCLFPVICLVKMAVHPKPGSGGGFFLLEGSHFFPQSPMCCSRWAVEIRQLLLCYFVCEWFCALRWLLNKLKYFPLTLSEEKWNSCTVPADLQAAVVLSDRRSPREPRLRLKHTWPETHRHALNPSETTCDSQKRFKLFLIIFNMNSQLLRAVFRKSW